MTREERKLEVSILSRKAGLSVTEVENYRRRPFINMDVMFTKARDAVEAIKAAEKAKEQYDIDFPVEECRPPDNNAVDRDTHKPHAHRYNYRTNG